MVSSSVGGISVPGGPRGLVGASVKRLATVDQPTKMPQWASAISGNYSQNHHRPHRTHLQQQLQRGLGCSGSPSTSTWGKGRRAPPADVSEKQSIRRHRHSGDSFSGTSGVIKRSASVVIGGGSGGGGGSDGGVGDGGHHAGTHSGWRKSSIEPREAILQIASEFLTVAHRRLVELGEKQKTSELLDGKAFMVRL